jgi:putative transposase
LREAGDGDFLRGVAEAAPRLSIEAGVEGAIGAGRRERTADRQTRRNGCRERAPDTRLRGCLRS